MTDANITIAIPAKVVKVLLERHIGKGLAQGVVPNVTFVGYNMEAVADPGQPSLGLQVTFNIIKLSD